MRLCRTRARIFSATNGATKSVDNSSEGKAKPNTWALTGEGSSDRITVKSVSIAKGPVEGSRGFERRRNRRGGNGASAHPSPSNIAGAPFVDGRQSRKGSGYNDTNARGTIRSGRDGNRNGNGIATGAASSTSSANCVPSGGARRYANDSSCGDMQDPDFDRNYMKWARRELVNSNHSVQAPTMGVPIYAAPLIYPYVTQALQQHPIHSAPISVHSSIALPTATSLMPPHLQNGLSTGLSNGLIGMHHRGILAGAAGMDVSMSLGINTNVARRDIIDAGGNGQLFTTLDQRCRENGSIVFATPNLGISCGVSSAGLAMGTLPIPHASIQDISTLPNSHGVSKMNMPIGPSQPQHTVSAMMNWPSQSVPAVVRPPQPPAYGLDSTVDFPPLR